MNKKFLACIIGLFTCCGAFAAPARPDAAEAVTRAVQPAVNKQNELAAARSRVGITLRWLGPDYREVSCAGALIMGGRRVVTHKNCLQPPVYRRPIFGAPSNVPYQFEGFAFVYADGTSYGRHDAPKTAGEFAWWDLGNLEAPAHLGVQIHVLKGNGTAADLFASFKKPYLLSLVYDGIFDQWHPAPVKNGQTFALLKLWRDKPLGEPVFMGGKLIALNSRGRIQVVVGGALAENLPWFTVFNEANGGAAAVR